MKVRAIMQASPIALIPGADALELAGNNQTVVLFFHGYTGYPAELLPTAEALQQQGYTVVLPRLAGHGSKLRDFYATNAADWLSQALQLHLHWSHRGYQVIPAGLSMGGLIACWLAACQNSPRLLLLAPAFALQDRRAYLAPMLRGISPFLSLPRSSQRPSSTNPSSAPDPSSPLNPEEQLRAQISAIYHGASRQAAPLTQLLQIRKWALASLGGLRAQVFLALAENDSSVHSARTERVLRRHLQPQQLQCHYLPDAGHVLTRREYQPALLPALLNWLESTAAPERSSSLKRK